MEMIKCRKCQHEIDNNAKFCSYCGNPIEKEISCENCGNKLQETDNFCSQCGYSVKKEPTELNKLVEPIEAVKHVESVENVESIEAVAPIKPETSKNLRRKKFTKEDLYVVCKKCNTKQIMDINCCNCGESLITEENFTPIRYANILAMMSNNSFKTNIDILGDYTYLKLDEIFFNNYYNEDTDDKKITIFNKELELTHLSKQMVLLHKKFNEAVDRWYDEFVFTTPYESFDKISSHCLKSDSVILDYVKFIAENTEVKIFDLFKLIDNEHNLFHKALQEIMNSEIVKNKVNLQKSVEEYDSKNNELINSTVGKQLGMMYGSNSKTLTAIGTLVNASNLDSSSKALYDNFDSQMLEESKRVCRDTLLRIKSEFQYIINTCLLLIGSTYTKSNDPILKKNILDMCLFKDRADELGGIDYFLESHYVYDNYEYIINDIDDNDMGAFVELIKFYCLTDYFKSEVLPIADEDIKQKFEQLLTNTTSN